MDIRNQVKQLLRMCGHAFVRTVHERLDEMERQGNDLSLQTASLAETQSALLQASIHVVETLQGIQAVLAEDLARQVCVVETNDYEFRNPEVGLMNFLYPSLPTRTAIDVGAHVGEVSECLLGGGYEVFAFEPNPPIYERLIRRLGNRPAFHPFNLALGSNEAEMPLHLAEDLSGSNMYVDQTTFSSLVAHSMPEDLPFTGSTTVSVRRFDSLHRSGVIPADISLVKIDTEGFDLEVVRGMGDYRYPVVVAEFWDKEIPFGRAGVPYTMESLVEEMRQRDYRYHIVIYRVWGQDPFAYYCNGNRSVANAYGNVFFFSERSLFAEAQAWCSAVLPRTYFKPTTRPLAR